MADYITLDSSNASNKGTNNWRYFADLTFNGVGVTYVPAEFLAKGVVVDGVQYWDNGFTNPEVLKYMKPVELDSSLLKNSQISKLYSNPTKGYIFDWGSAAASDRSINDIYTFTLKSYTTPITGMTKTANGYQYVGVGDNRFSTFSPTTVHSEWADNPGGLFGILADLGGAIASLGPAVLLVDLIPGMQGIGTAIYAGSQAGQGNYTNAALAVAAANLPSGSGTTGLEGSMLEIPSIGNMAKSLTGMGLDAAAANAVMQGGLKLIASGGDIEKAFTEVLGTYVGAKAGDYVAAMKGFDGYKDLQSIAANVTKASTAAFMKNQDVGKAASTAFINTSIPIAFNSVPGFKDFAKANPTAASALINGTIATANGKDVSLQATIRNSALDFMADQALSKAPGYSSMTAAEKKSYKDLAIAQAQGKPLDNALYSIMASKIESGVNNASAKKEGWADYAEKQTAIALLGKGATPKSYDAAVVNKDEALQFFKDAGLTRDPTESELAKLMKGTELNAKEFAKTAADIDSVTFDGTKYKTNEEALMAASKAGYNTFKGSDGQIYTIMSKEQYNNVAAAAQKAGVANPFSDVKHVDINGNQLSGVVTSTEIPEIVITASRLSNPDTYEAWLKNQDELKQLGGTSFPKWISDQLNLLDIITKENKGTKAGDAANLIEQAMAFGGRNFGNLAKQISQSAAATGLVDYNNVAARTAAAIERWGKAVQGGLVARETKITDYVADTESRMTKELDRKPTTSELMFGQAKAFYSAFMKDPLAGASLVGGEALQEAPWMVASGGVGKLATGLFGKAVGYAAAMGTDGALNAAESFAGNYTDVYESLRKKGFSDEAAKAKATTSGIEAALVTFGTSILGDNALVKSFMGEATKLSAGMLTKEATKQYVTEYMEGTLQNASSQYAINGKVDWGKATAAGAIEGAIGSAVSTGFISANGLNETGIVGKDDKGNNVTLREYLDGKKQVKTIDDNFNLSKDASNQITIGDAKNYYTEFTKNPDITSTEYFQTVDFFRDSGYGTPTSAEITKIVGGQTDLTGTKLQEAVNTYTDPYIIDKQELTDLFKAEGYGAPTAAELAKYSGKINESTGNESARAYADSLSVTSQEAKDALIAAGISKPTAAQIAQFTKTGKEADIISQLNAYADPLVVTEAEAKKAFADQGISNPTKEQLAKFVKEGNQSTILSDLAAYADPLAVTNQEAKDALIAAGIPEPTAEQITKFAKVGSESTILSDIKTYADPLVITADEVRAAFKAEGYTPTDKEVAMYTGYKSQGATETEIAKYADPKAVTEAEAKDFFTTEGYVPTAKELALYVGNKDEAQIAKDISKYADPLAVTEAEAKDYFKAEGYTPTAKELAQYIGNKNELDIASAISKYADPFAMTEQEVKDAFLAEGVSKPTAEQIAKYVKQGNESELLANLKAEADPLGVTTDELIQFFKDEGYTKAPTKEELAKFTGQFKESDVLASAHAYADPLAVTQSEAEQFFKDLGYTPTKEDLAAYIGNYNETDTLGSINKKYDPLATTEQEVRDMFKTIGYEPSDSEVARYVGQKAEDVQLDLVKNYGNTALAVKELTGPLNTRIDELVKQGQDYQTATKNAIDELVTSNKDLSAKIGTEAKTVTQEDIDAINKMLSGETKTDLAYDVNKDNKITQEDIDALSKYIKSDTNPNPETNFDPYTNTHWAPTGLYKTVYDQNIQRQQDLEAAKAREAENLRKSQLTQGVLGFQSAVSGLLPQIQQLQTQANAQAQQPIEVVEKSKPLDFSNPLDVGFFGADSNQETEKQKLAQKQQGIVKIASGGSIDGLLSLLYRG